MPGFRREVGEAQRDPNVALTGSGPKVDGIAPNVGSDRVSPKLQDIRSRLDGLGNAVDQNRWLPSNSDTERRDWIRANSAHIKDAAAYTGLPADMIAGIAWREVQGDPKWVDDVSDNFRQNQHEVWPEFQWVADKVGLTGEADQTSMGPIAIQIRRSAEVLGYDPENMTQAQRDEVERATQDPATNVYNGGPSWRTDDAQAYGRGFGYNLDDARQALASKFRDGPPTESVGRFRAVGGEWTG
ncbi:hypothetical protein ACIOHB_35850 [Streptomyces microflavus]|uniref:hypothetical protein n=1 Tax=Streptomyces microflavus TaxID=1919 RepID=UPI0033C26839